MSEFKKVEPRNPKTLSLFQQEARWQIVFPVLMAALVVIVFLALLMPLFGLLGVSVVADYSIFFTFVLVTMFASLTLIILLALIYLVSQMINSIPPYTYKAQQSLQTTREVTDNYTDMMAKALIEQRSRAVGAATFIQELKNEDQPEVTTHGK